MAFLKGFKEKKKNPNSQNYILFFLAEVSFKYELNRFR